MDTLFFNADSKWFAVKKTKISADYTDDIWQSLERDIFPVMGLTLAAELKVAALEPVRARGTLETLHRLTQRINKVKKFSINTGLLDVNPVYTISEAFLRPQKAPYGNRAP